MKLSDIFRKKSTISKADKAIVKIDKKQLAKITGGATLLETNVGAVVTDNKHPEGRY